MTLLGTCTSKIGSGVTPRGGDAVYVSEGVALIRSQNIYNGEFSVGGLAHITERQAALMDGVSVLPEDVLLNITGDSVARCTIVPADILPARVNQHVAIIRPERKKLLPKFLMYFLISPGMQGYMLSIAGSGGTRNALTKGMIEKFDVPTPPLAEQQRIVDVLSTYDELIENNRRRIELLEESARLLYREWFVRLRFPGHEHVKVVDGVPEGWRRMTLGEVCEYVEDGDWIESKDQGGDDFRLLQVSNIGVDSFVETGNFRYVSDETFRRLNCREIHPGDILISRMPDPIGRAWLATNMPWRMITAVDVAIARVDRSRVVPHYLLQHLNTSASLELAAKHATGATRLRISRKSLCALPISVPPIELQEEFDEMIAGNYALRSNLKTQEDKLRQARDLLLPRLMSGDLAV